MIWEKTTEKDGKVYNDMFITDHRGKYEYIEAYKGEIIDFLY